MTVPTATYTPGNFADPTLPPFLQFIGNLACRLASSVEPFDKQAEIELYPNHGMYVNQVVHAANQLRQLLTQIGLEIRSAEARGQRSFDLEAVQSFMLEHIGQPDNR